MGDLVDVVIILGLAYTTYKIIELFVRRNERMTLIEKMDFKNGIGIPSGMIEWPIPPKKRSFSILHLGLLLVGIGLGLIIAVFVNYYFEFDKEVTYLASIMLFGGLGLMVSFLIERKEVKQK